MNSKLKKLEDQLEQVKNEMKLYHGSDIVGCTFGNDFCKANNISVSKDRQKKFNTLCNKCDKLEDKIEELKDKLGIPPS